MGAHRWYYSIRRASVMITRNPNVILKEAASPLRYVAPPITALPHKKSPIPVADIWTAISHIVPLAHPTHHPKRHLDRVRRFSKIHSHYQRTDGRTNRENNHRTRLVIGLITSCCTAMTVTALIASVHESFNSIGQVAPMCTPSNTRAHATIILSTETRLLHFLREAVN